MTSASWYFSNWSSRILSTISLTSPAQNSSSVMSNDSVDGSADADLNDLDDAWLTDRCCWERGRGSISLCGAPCNHSLVTFFTPVYLQTRPRDSLVGRLLRLTDITDEPINDWNKKMRVNVKWIFIYIFVARKMLSSVIDLPKRGLWVHLVNYFFFNHWLNSWASRRGQIKACRTESLCIRRFTWKSIRCLRKRCEVETGVISRQCEG